MSLTPFVALLVGIVLFGTILGFHTKEDSFFDIICGIIFIFTPLFWLSVTMIGGIFFGMKQARFNEASAYISNQWIPDLGLWVLWGSILTLSIRAMQWRQEGEVEG